MGSPFRGIVEDFKGRLACYKQDWKGGFTSGFRILAPTIYIFFASVIPSIAFGEQLYRDTDMKFSAVHTVASTALCGLIHSVFGGQPLLIIGVAEPTVLMYSFLYRFAAQREDLGEKLFIAWVAWVCTWTSLMLMGLAISGACSIINRFTRVAGELLGMLIALLFMQEAIKSMVKEFHVPENEDPDLEEYSKPWLFANGFFGLLLCLGVLYTSIKSREARSWKYGTGWFRGFIADFGVPVMILVATTISYSFSGAVPEGVPRRLSSPNPWTPPSDQNWIILKHMHEVPYTYVVGAIVPAAMITGLYFFDHSIAAQMAQQKEFNLTNPSAYHYDLFLLGVMVLICGLLGLPPSYGLLPQSPMHTKSLATLRRQIVRKKLVETAKKGMEEHITFGELYENIQEVYQKMEISSPVPLSPSAPVAGFKNTQKLVDSKPNAVYSIDESPTNTVNKNNNYLGNLAMASPDMKVDMKDFDPEKHVDSILPVQVKEQRLTNLMQSLLIGACVGALPILKKIPTSVLAGYFAYMSIESLPGNQFWERIQLLLIPPSRRFKVLELAHVSFVETVPFRTIAMFTVLQFAFLLVCFGITWIPMAGFLFPVVFFALIPVRQYILPRFFDPDHLWDLDAAEYDEVPAILPHYPENEGAVSGRVESIRFSLSDDEILDVMTTRGRGELKRRGSISDRKPFVMIENKDQIYSREPSYNQDHNYSISFRDKSARRSVRFSTELMRKPTM